MTWRMSDIIPRWTPFTEKVRGKKGELFFFVPLFSDLSASVLIIYLIVCFFLDLELPPDVNKQLWCLIVTVSLFACFLFFMCLELCSFEMYFLLFLFPVMCQAYLSFTLFFRFFSIYSLLYMYQSFLLLVTSNQIGTTIKEEKTEKEKKSTLLFFVWFGFCFYHILRDCGDPLRFTEKSLLSPKLDITAHYGRGRKKK